MGFFWSVTALSNTVTTILFLHHTDHISSVQQPLSSSSQEGLLLDNTDAEYGRPTDIVKDKLKAKESDGLGYINS